MHGGGRKWWGFWPGELIAAPAISWWMCRGEHMYPCCGAGCLGSCLRGAYLQLDCAPHRVLTACSGGWCMVQGVCSEEVGRQPDYGGFCFVLLFLLLVPRPIPYLIFCWHYIWIQDSLLLLAVVYIISYFEACIFPLLCGVQETWQKETDSLTGIDFCALSLPYFTDRMDLFLLFCDKLLNFSLFFFFF